MNRGDEDMGAGNRWSGSYSRVSLATLTRVLLPFGSGPDCKEGPRVNGM